MKILVTRPQPGAGNTAARLAAMGHDPVIAPCLKIIPRPAVLPEHPAAVIITSGMAIPALPAAYRQVPVFCVGDATAGRLRAAGFRAVESAAGDADDLYRLIMARRLAGTYVMAVGQRHGQKLARQLRAHGRAVLRRAVYSARPTGALPAPAAAALAAGEVHAALFYSAETARAFARLKAPMTGQVEALALSGAVADSLIGLPWTKIRVAVAPTEADLLALLS